MNFLSNLFDPQNDICHFGDIFIGKKTVVIRSSEIFSLEICVLAPLIRLL